MAPGCAMKRVLVTGLVSLIFEAIWQAFAIGWPVSLNVFFSPPIVLVFAVYYFKPLETIAIALLCGLIIDVLGGFLIGSNMLLMLVISFAMSGLSVFSGRIHRRDLIYYVIAISFFYRMCLLGSTLILFGGKANILVSQLLIGPLVDGLFSVPFYFVLVKVLAVVKAFDQNEFFKNRIGYRP